MTHRALVAQEAAAFADAGTGLAREVLADAQDVAGRLEQRAALEASLVAAEEQRADQEARRDLLERAQRAIPVRPLVELVDGPAEQVTTLRAAVVAAGPGQVADPTHLVGEGWQELAGQAAAARTTAGELAHLVVIEDGLAEGRALLERHRMRAQELQAAVIAGAGARF